MKDNRDPRDYATFTPCVFQYYSDTEKNDKGEPLLLEGMTHELPQLTDEELIACAESVAEQLGIITEITIRQIEILEIN